MFSYFLVFFYKFPPLHFVQVLGVQLQPETDESYQEKTSFKSVNTKYIKARKADRIMLQVWQTFKGTENEHKDRRVVVAEEVVLKYARN